MAETTSEGFVSDNLIPTADGDFLTFKSGDKKGLYVTLAELSALTSQQQDVLLRSQDPEWLAKMKAINTAKRDDPVWMEKMRALAKEKSNDPVWRAARKIINARFRQDPEYHKNLVTGLRKANCKIIEGELSIDWLNKKRPEFELDPLWKDKPTLVIHAALKLHAPELTKQQRSSIVAHYVYRYVLDKKEPERPSK